MIVSIRSTYFSQIYASNQFEKHGSSNQPESMNVRKRGRRKTAEFKFQIQIAYIIYLNSNHYSKLR